MGKCAWHKLDFTLTCMDTKVCILLIGSVRRNKLLLNIIARNVKHYRDDLRISQESLAERADVHRNYVARVEAAGIDISVSGLFQLAKGLRVEPCDLLKK